MNQFQDNRDNENNNNIDDVKFESYNDEVSESIEEVDEEGLELSAQEKLQRLKKKLKQCDKERIENLTGWQRAKADFVNLKKRSSDSTNRQVELAKQSVVEIFFPIIDSFEVAMSGKAWDEASEGWKNGIESIFKQFISALSASGVKEIDCLGKPFDPYLHTSVAVKATEDEKQDHIIAEVMQKGYVSASGEVIRSPKVVVFHFER